MKIGKMVSFILVTLSTSLFLTIAHAEPDMDSPPGLQGKGGAEFPKGLEKNEKVPEGWSHGKKHGWDHHGHHHGHHHGEGNGKGKGKDKH